jgi:hypothetical protein
MHLSNIIYIETIAIYRHLTSYTQVKI